MGLFMSYDAHDNHLMCSPTSLLFMFACHLPFISTVRMRLLPSPNATGLGSAWDDRNYAYAMQECQYVDVEGGGDRRSALTTRLAHLR